MFTSHPRSFQQSIGDSSLLSTLKVPKFFLQFQITRVNTANGVAPATAADTTAHQLAKVIKVRAPIRVSPNYVSSVLCLPHIYRTLLGQQQLSLQS